MQNFNLKFVDLIKVIYCLAVCIEPKNAPHLAVFTPDPSDKISELAGRRFWERVQHDIDLAEQVSKAAMLLSRSLQDSTNQNPQFVRFDFTKNSVWPDPRAEQEGKKILSSATQRCEKEYLYCIRHYFKAMTLGEGFLDDPIARDAEDNLFIPNGNRLIQTGIGFDLTQIIVFLNKNDIRHSLDAPRYREKRRSEATALQINQG